MAENVSESNVLHYKKYFLEIHDSGIGMVHPGYGIVEYFFPSLNMFLNEKCVFTLLEKEAQERLSSAVQVTEFAIPTELGTDALVYELLRRVDRRQEAEKREKELADTVRMEPYFSDFATSKTVVLKKEEIQITLWVDILQNRVYSYSVSPNTKGFMPAERVIGVELSEALTRLKGLGFVEVQEGAVV